MDLVADMLLDQLTQNYSNQFATSRICPPWRRRFSRAQTTPGSLLNTDRFLNRFWDYPHYLRGRKSEFDLFHLVDHSYGQLLRELPWERTLVTCHDLDTFQCLLNPEQGPRSFLFRKMMERTLDGFRRAARVCCDSIATRDELVRHGLADLQRVAVVPNGVHPSCSPAADAEADRKALELLGETAAGERATTLDVLHVGSTIPRKRIDLLLRILAAVRKELATVRLIRVGGPFSQSQELLVNQFGLASSILVLPQLDRDVLAAVYRSAAVVLLTSEREGFGLPVVEALACGTPVIATDLPVLREVGGEAVQYCPLDNVAAWTEVLLKLLHEAKSQSSAYAERRTAGLAQASKFSWTEYTDKVVRIYRELLPG
jgi:glycosyltransferase involved in cell wall biosynthesis